MAKTRTVTVKLTEREVKAACSAIEASLAGDVLDGIEEGGRKESTERNARRRAADKLIQALQQIEKK